MHSFIRVKYLHPVKRSFDDTLSKERNDQDDLKRKQQTKRMVLAEEEVFFWIEYIYNTHV